MPLHPEVRMRVATAMGSALLGCLSCVSATEPETNLILETDQTSYVATEATEARFDYSTRIITTFRNETDGVIRINGCTATVTHPPYVVQGEDAAAAWTPDITCVTTGIAYQDIPSGGERVDTLQLRAPWRRQFNSQPVGPVEGDFRILFDVQICGSVTRFGQCFISNSFGFARSNKFTISVR